MAQIYSNTEHCRVFHEFKDTSKYDENLILLVEQDLEIVMECLGYNETHNITQLDFDWYLSFNLVLHIAPTHNNSSTPHKTILFVACYQHINLT